MFGPEPCRMAAREVETPGDSVNMVCRGSWSLRDQNFSEVVNFVWMAILESEVNLVINQDQMVESQSQSQSAMESGSEDVVACDNTLCENGWVSSFYIPGPEDIDDFKNEFRSCNFPSQHEQVSEASVS